MTHDPRYLLIVLPGALSLLFTYLGLRRKWRFLD